jgi:beta-galactosidase
LDEAGNPTEKFHKFRNVIAKHLPSGITLPPVPEPGKSIAIEQVTFDSSAAVFENLPQPVSNKAPLAFEDLDQAYGFVLYRAVLDTGKAGWLKIEGLRDYAIVYINGKQVAVLDRRLGQDSVFIGESPRNTRLDIWVENNGRINYGPYLTDNRKGIVGLVTLGGSEIQDWRMYGFPFTDMSGINFKGTSGNSNPAQPSCYKGTFTLKEREDTYLDMRSFGKGFVFLNGHNLGKYWNIGPQQTIYVPACWLKKGENEVIVFDALKQGHTILNSLREPILDEIEK